MISSFLQSWFFVDVKNIFAENPTNRTHLIAIFVDKDVYSDQKTNIEKYATDYIQQKISNSKAIVMPINTKTFKAHELTKILENMYFDGVKGETSDLLGTILIGDIPLPVVQQDGFVFPSIYPYVDFEDQQYVYDANQNFFVYNDMPKGQPEIWHGLINFGKDSSKYSKFFEKLREYNTNPSSFVSSAIWYDDFLGMKNTFSMDTLPYYVNNFLFTEDIGYHRFTNLMLDYFKAAQNNEMSDLVQSLANLNPDDQALTDLQAEGQEALGDLGNSKVPTTMLLSVIKEMIKSYDNLYPGVFLTKMRDNEQAASRWYKTTSSGELVDALDSHLHKLMLKDVFAVGDIQNGVAPLITSYNDKLEKALDAAIETGKRYMDIPVFAKYSYDNYKTRSKVVGLRNRWRCENFVSDEYKNYYFGTLASDIYTAQQFSTYRGTFRNLSNLSGVLINSTGYTPSTGISIGASYGLFDTQVDANRGYNIMSAAKDFDSYNTGKIINKKEISCSNYFRIMGIWKAYCRKRESKPVGSEYETLEDFGIRAWGGASSTNLDTGLMENGIYQLKTYDYRSSMLPIYDIGGSKALETAQITGYSYVGFKDYSSIIKQKDRYGILDYPKYIKSNAEMEESYPNGIYGNLSGGFVEIIGTNRIRTGYDNLDYFKVYNRDFLNSIPIPSKLKLLNLSRKDESDFIQNQTKAITGSAKGGQCDGKRETISYSYNLVDSRVKNTAVESDQVNGFYKDKFATGSIRQRHYEYLYDSLGKIESKTNLSGDFTSIDSGLNYAKTVIADINAGISEFTDLPSSATTGQLLESLTGILKESDKISVYNQMDKISYQLSTELSKQISDIGVLTFGNILLYFDNIKETESVYNEKTQFLSGWISNLSGYLDNIYFNYNSLSGKVQKTRNLAFNLKNISYSTGLLSDQKIKINKKENCGTTLNPDYCGCNNKYKQVCDKIDTLITNINQLSEKTKTLDYYDYTGLAIGEDGVESVVNVTGNFFDDFQDSIEGNSGFLIDSLYVKSYINNTGNFISLDKIPQPEYVKGLNQTTLDRPIDSNRNITFQGLSGSLVKFDYPNLYKIEIYIQSGSLRILKSIPEISASIKAYLTGKVAEYNRLLAAQESGRINYYNKNKAAFDLLANDTLATPNRITPTKGLDTDYFINILGESYINQLAETMYYTNLPTYIRKNQTYVDADLASITSKFDISKKIAYIVSGYLTEGNDQGPIVTPGYNGSGYEVAYINSDGADYIAREDTPDFIARIQNAQANITSGNSANTYDEVLAGDEGYATTQAECGLDANYSAALFDGDSSPWIDSLRCWIQKLPTSVKFEMEFAAGPSIQEFLDSLDSTFSNRLDSLKNINNTGGQEAGAGLSGDFGEYRGSMVYGTGESVIEPILPKTISFEMPATTMIAGGQIPIRFSALDKSGNVMKDSPLSYKVVVTSGDGQFVAPYFISNESQEFSSFNNTILIYQAPKLSSNKTVTLTLSGKDFKNTQDITVKPASIEITNLLEGNIIYNDNTKKTISLVLSGVDSTYTTIPRLKISIKAKDGTLLSTSFSVTSKNGLIKPGIVGSGVFKQATSYFIDDKGSNAGKIIVYLMPSFKAGDDEISINIPGLDSIKIPISIAAGQASKIVASSLPSSFGIGDTFSGSLFITDNRGNLIQASTNIKIGVIGPLSLKSSNGSSTSQDIDVVGGKYDYKIQTNQPGGSAYIYASINDLPLDSQYPAYKQIFVQDTYIPQNKLNVMYLNLFGTDWGNQWGYLSSNSGYIPELMSNSNKLLAVTTQLTDPVKLKKFDVIVSQNGQVYNLGEKNVSLKIKSGQLLSIVQDEGEISLGDTKNMIIHQENKEGSKTPQLIFQKNSLIEDQLTISDYKITFSGELLLDLKNNIWSDNLNISLQEGMQDSYSIWDVYFGDISLGTMMFDRSDDWILTNTKYINIYNSINYGRQETFAEGSTNGNMGIGIYDNQATFENKSYPSIQDSANYELGIGFTSDFKNITLFGDGKSVGESTMPYGSAFLINFGDPLLTRIDKNKEITDLKLDTGIGEQIYSEPNKTIFKTLPVDFNIDGLQDLIIVFTDGTIKLLKNYGGTHPYKPLQDLLRLSDGIKDVKIGDVDKNGYPDLLIWTTSDQLRVYKNNSGVFDVDGNLICLNTNVLGDDISTDPEHILGIQQIFFEDMDKDGSLDITVNDKLNDVKIFYGGKTNGYDNYVSKLSYTCDPDRYSRQKNNIKLVKSFGVKIKDDYIQDSSLIHIPGRYITDGEGYTEDNNSNPDTTAIETSDPADMSNIMKQTSDILATAADNSLKDQLIDNPFKTVPVYEKDKEAEEIGYKQLINLSGNKEISVYKQYKDINGGVLSDGDQVKITITFLALKNNIKATYLDTILGPRQIPIDSNNKITTWEIDVGNYDVGDITWSEKDYSFVMDNILLNKNEKLVVSYIVNYTASPLITVNVKDEQLYEEKKSKDLYPDIIVMPIDSCKKYRRVFFNDGKSDPQEYTEIFDNIQARLDTYTKAGQTEGDDIIDNALPKADSEVDSGSSAEESQEAMMKLMNDVSNMPGMQSLNESFKLSDVFPNVLNGISVSNFNMDGINQMLSPMNDKLDKLLDSLCQGFKLGKSCGQPPVPFNLIPFNQAFLAPGQYNIFGCRPVYLRPLLETLDRVLGPGIPAIFFPGTLQAGPYQIPMIGSAFLPIVFQNAASDGFGFSSTYPPKSGIYPSQLRLYLVPTTTMQMGVAQCFGPYTLGAKIPPLFRDLGGNCIVTAFPMYPQKCGDDSNTSGDEPDTESLESWMTDLAANGSCVAPSQFGRAKVVSNSLIIEEKPTFDTAFAMSSHGGNNSSWTPALPSNGVLGFGDVSFYDKPTKKTGGSTTFFADDMGFGLFEFKEGDEISLKILGAKGKGIAEKIMKDWFGRQIKYMINNLTKLTVSVTLPDVSNMFQGFDKLASSDSRSESWKQSKENDLNKPNAKNSKIKNYMSRQEISNISDLTNNPFDAVIDMFQQVPLVDIHTKDINIKIPMVTSDDLQKYISYLKGWLKTQSAILKRRVETINEIMNICGVTITADAQASLDDLDKEDRIILDAQKANLLTIEEASKFIVSIEKERTLYQNLIDNPQTQAPSITEDVAASRDATKANFGFLGQKMVGLPRMLWIEKQLSAKTNKTTEEKLYLDRLKERISKLSSCGTFTSNIDNFINFYSESTKLIRNIQLNIQTLEQYKAFPLQLYDWIHVTDRYLSDISSFLSNTIFVLMNWLTINSKIYSKYVDALVLILSALKTWQILIDISTNWSKKCGKCTEDSYGSHSCGLSFLLDSIKLPIYPIPPFKIPNIYIDLSHIDLGISFELPKFNFVPMKLALPQLPNIPEPPNVNVNLDIDLTFFGNLSLPDIPLLPAPPVLPELPSFIPKVDFKLPTLPPAPKIPNITSEFSATLDAITIITKIFCILKKGVGLVAEKGVKAKVEQLTQRTWEVPYVDNFDISRYFKKDPPLKGFDLKVDGYLQFKMDFEGFYTFLDQIAAGVNSLSSGVEGLSKKYISEPTQNASKRVDNFNQENIKDVNMDMKFETDLNMDLNPLGSSVNYSDVNSGVDYEVAHKQLSKGLAYLSENVNDPAILNQVNAVKREIDTNNIIRPADKALYEVQKQAQDIIAKKQTEIRSIAKGLKQYDRFLARVENNDIALVSDENIDVSFKVPLFTTDDSTLKMLASQEHPLKTYLDTNAALANRYLNTLENSSPSEMNIDALSYNKTKTYLTDLNSKIAGVYDRLGFSKVAYSSCGMPVLLANNNENKPLLAQTSGSPSSTNTSNNASDLSSYVRGVFVEKQLLTGVTMVNTVRSDKYISKIGSNYMSLNINKDNVNDVLMRDSHNIYIKYGSQNKNYDNIDFNDTYYEYSIDSYDELVKDYVNDDDKGYVKIGDTYIKLVDKYQEVKNFKMVGQSFDAIQFSWMTNENLGEKPDGYLLKLNHRIDTYSDKDQIYDLMNGTATEKDAFLNKRFVLLLPKDTPYSGAKINFGERFYYKNKNSDSADLLELLPGGDYSGVIMLVKYYDTTENKISLGLQEIPRKWQYSKITTLQNIGTEENQDYIISSPWSNQVVAGRQLLDDTIGPEAEIDLYRPSVSEVVSEGSDHKGFVGTNYVIRANWKDNVAVSKMRIEQDNKIIQELTGNQETGYIELSGLYFTGATSLSYVFAAEDFQGNTQKETVNLEIAIPEISVKDFVKISETSGQLISEISNDIDQGMVVFQRLRNQSRQEIPGTLSNKFGGFWLGPKQTIITGFVFSLGNTIGFYDNAGKEIGSVDVNGQMSIYPEYQDQYKISMDLSSSIPAVRIVDKNEGSTLFWIHLPPKELVDASISAQAAAFYDKISLSDPSFGGFAGGSCIQGKGGYNKECILYISNIGELYIPKTIAQSLQGDYYYDKINNLVIYDIKDFTDKSIIKISIKVDLFAK